MPIRTHVPWAGVLVCSFAITTFAQPPAAPTPAPRHQLEALLKSAAEAVAAGDSSQARDAYNQLLAAGRTNNDLDLVAQAQHGLGRAALAAHDPAAAIRHFQQADTREARAWLAVALMMESRSASDQYVERAFDAMLRARTNRPSPPSSRAQLAAAVRPGEAVIAFLIGETSAWAWAFDRDTFIAYPLPAPPEIATAVARVRAYTESGDREGVQRIADDLVPALLGPALGQLPKLRRLIFVVDGPLRDLPIGALPTGEDHSPLQQQIAVTVVEHDAVLDAITAEPAPPAARDASWRTRPLVMAAIAVGILLVAGVSRLARRRSRARS